MKAEVSTDLISFSARWCLLPWLIFYFFLLFVVFFSVPLVLVWFLIIQDGVEIFSLLALAPLLGGILLLCAWTHVNGLYVKVGLDELEGSNFKGPMTY